MKKCSICHLEKVVSDFPERKLSNGNIGHRGQCKDCSKKRMKKNYRIRQDKLNFLQTVIPETKKCGKCQIIKSSNEFNSNKARKDGLSVYCNCCNKQYFQRPERLQYEKERLKSRKTQEKYIEYHKQYRKKNMGKFVEKMREKYHSNPLEKLKHLYRTRILKFVSRKSAPSKSILGCSWEEFKKYIENQFTEGMNWDNHSQFGWHLDHIIPLSSANTEKEVEKLCHYTNYQPLWWRDNIIKGSKIIEDTNHENI